MRRREDHPLTKHTLNLFEGDFGRLQDLHGRIGAAKVIRELVRGHISRVEAKTPIPAIEPPKEGLGLE